ncbi:hypothetical protein E2C01_071213 [Portunus trituberculatus]|uniref:Uncharacterized protein n=1 Tax=Portunus trituberculatus TaxID=210409 RepID=A0A5B7HUT0_PORTR|nr:hypothetical protein [Portunus trituberculatus]
MRVKQMQAAPPSNVSYISTTDPLPAPSTTTASLSTCTSSSAKTTSTSTKTSPITSTAPYLSAISHIPSKDEKTDQSNKLTLTKLKRQHPSHVIAAPAP